MANLAANFKNTSKLSKAILWTLLGCFGLVTLITVALIIFVGFEEETSRALMVGFDILFFGAVTYAFSLLIDRTNIQKSFRLLGIFGTISSIVFGVIISLCNAAGPSALGTSLVHDTTSYYCRQDYYSSSSSSNTSYKCDHEQDNYDIVVPRLVGTYFLLLALAATTAGILAMENKHKAVKTTECITGAILGTIAVIGSITIWLSGWQEIPEITYRSLTAFSILATLGIVASFSLNLIFKDTRIRRRSDFTNPNFQVLRLTQNPDGTQRIENLSNPTPNTPLGMPSSQELASAPSSHAAQPSNESQDAAAAEQPGEPDSFKTFEQ